MPPSFIVERWSRPIHKSIRNNNTHHRRHHLMESSSNIYEHVMPDEMADKICAAPPKTRAFITALHFTIIIIMFYIPLFSLQYGVQEVYVVVCLS